MNVAGVRPRHYATLRRWFVPSLQGWSERLPHPTPCTMLGWWRSLQSLPLLSFMVPPAMFRSIGTTKDASSGILLSVETTSMSKKKDGRTSSKAGVGSSNNTSEGHKKIPRNVSLSPTLRDEKQTSAPVDKKDISPVERDMPRRIVVAKDPTKGDSTRKDGDLIVADKGNPSIGILKRRFPLEREITDSTGKVIWVPARSVIEKGNVVATQLPQIHATAWLDPSMYCPDGGTSIAGTEAARKLLRGKKDLMELLGYAVHNTSSSKHVTTVAMDRDASTSNKREQKRSFVLQGHGVPHQMLQHHVDFAASLLYQLEASEVSFKQFNVTQHHNSSAASDAVRELQRTHVRDAETGENKILPWPLDDGDHSKDDLQLYWTAMNRIATRLGLAVLLKRPRDATLPADETSLQSLWTDRFTSSNSLLKTPPHHWKVEFTRQWQFAPQQLPPRKTQISPVLEWSPLDGIATPGHVCIWLQGVSSERYNGAALRVSLCFDACFRRNLSSSYGLPAKP